MKFFIDISILRRNRNYCFLYLGQSISFFGIMMTSVTLPYQIYHETHSTLMVGLLSLAQLLPLLFTALIGGTIADRYNRRRLILISEIFLVLNILILSFNANLTHPSLILLFIVSAFSSAITGLHRPAMTSMVQQIVPKEDFAMVGALNGLSFSTAAVVGPAVGGLVIAHFGLVSGYLFNAVTFLISLLALMAMQNIPNPEYHQEESTWTSLKQGLKFAASRQELLGTYYVDFIAMIFGMPTALFPALAQQFGGVRVLGLLYAAPAAGMLIF